MVEDRVNETEFYSIYRVAQDAFKGGNWITSPPALANISRRMQALPRIDKFLHIRQGFVTGADKIFTVTSDQINDLDAELFVPLFVRSRNANLYSTGPIIEIRVLPVRRWS